MKAMVSGHAVFLALAIGLATWAWTDEDEGRDDAPVLLDVEPEQLSSVRLTWPKGEAVYTPDGQGDARTWRVALTRELSPKKEEPADEPHDDEASEQAGAKAPEADAKSAEEMAEQKPKAEPEKEETVFPAGRTVQRSLEKLAPFKARRSLGTVEGDRLEKMGLSTPERRLGIEAGKKRLELEIGAETYGRQARYARIAGKPEVFLIDAAAVRGLEGTPASLMESRLVPLELEDITGVEVALGERRAAFTHVDRDQPKKRFFARADVPEERSEEAGGLVSTLRGLRATRYLDGPKVEAGPVLEIRVLREKGGPLDVVLFEKADGSGYLVRAGTWFAELSTPRGKNLLEDAQATLPTE